jgi:hypothetical protein
MYADDTMLLAHSKDALEKMLEAAHKWATDNGAKFNAAKTDVFVGGASEHRERGPVHFGDQEVQVQSGDATVRYLGVFVSGKTHGNGAGIDMCTRISATNKMVASAGALLRPGWLREGSGAKVKFSRDLVAAAFVPTLIFGGQTGTILKAQLEGMKKSHGRAVRACLGAQATTPNTAMRIDLGLLSVEAELARARVGIVRWFVRHPVESYRRLFHAVYTNVDGLGNGSGWREQTEASMRALGLTLADVQNKNVGTAEWKALLKQRMILHDAIQARDHNLLPQYPLSWMTRKLRRSDNNELMDSPYEVVVRKVERSPPQLGAYEVWKLRPAPYIVEGGARAHHGYLFRTGFNYIGAKNTKCAFCGGDTDTPAHVWTCEELPADLRRRIVEVSRGREFREVLDFAEARKGEGGKPADTESVMRTLELLAELRKARVQAKLQPYE